ncbi:MAG TPA: CoA-binding protein [Desulfobacterales bacterium]|nr:CoA-binding protein [Desulfobacterales bacterium]
MSELKIINDEELCRILSDTQRIAVVGMSPKPNRPSNQVAAWLMAAGFEVIPVNPGQSTIMGLKCYPDLESIPGQVDIVDVFRRPAEVPAIVDSALKIRAKVLWLQLGVIHAEAARRAQAAGLRVIMDRCLKVEHKRLKDAGLL